MSAISRLWAGVLLAMVSASPAIADDCAREAAARSLPGGAASEVTFLNASAVERRIYWIDENGRRLLKGIAEAGKSSRQPSVAAHTWVVTDAAEKCLYVVQASSAPMTVEVGGVVAPSLVAAGTPPAASAPVQAPVLAPVLAPALADVSPIRKYGLKGWYQISSIARPEFGLNTLASGFPELERLKPDWESGYWQFEEVAGTPFVLIQNKWKLGYLQDDKGSLRVTASARDNEAAHWALDGAETGPYGRIRNRKDGRYLVSTRAGFDLVPSFDGTSSSFWTFKALTTGQGLISDAPVAAAAATTTVASPPPRRKPAPEPSCGKHEIYSPSRGRCIDKASTCERDELYSTSVAQCVAIASTCSSRETYNASRRECVPKKAEPAPPPKPVVTIRKGCEEGFRLIDGECRRIKRNDPPNSCPPGTRPVPQTDNCVWKTDKKGFEVEPWKKPGCIGWQVACKAGNNSACRKYEETCQVN